MVLKNFEEKCPLDGIKSFRFYHSGEVDFIYEAKIEHGICIVYWGTGEKTNYTVSQAVKNIKSKTWILTEILPNDLKERNMYIASNQITCKKCGDSIYSMHRHHFVTCSCGACSVDGGQEYLRRLGNREDIEDISIMIEKEALDKIVADTYNSMESGRNPLGVALAVLRSIRDNNVKQDGLNWILEE